MSTLHDSFIQSHNMTSSSSSSSVENGTFTMGNITSTTEYVCMGIADRALLLVKEPHKTIALLLGFIGIVINILCLIAVQFQMHGRFTTHFRFIVSLAASDILIALSFVSNLVNSVLNPTGYPGEGPDSLRLHTRCAWIIIKALNTTALNISLLNLMGMALDHYFAIILPLHCHQLLSKRRSTLLIISFWIIAIVCGFSDFFSVIPDRKYLSKFYLCELVYLTPYQDEFTVFVIALLCFICMVFIYVKIYMKIHERKVLLACQDDCRAHLSDNMKQTKKALVTTLMILGTFIICWLPMCFFQVILIIQVKVNPKSLEHLIPIFFQADKYLYDLLLMNPILDPIIYAIRMPEVRCGYRKMCWRFVRCCKRDSLPESHSATYISLVDKRSSVQQLRQKTFNTKRQTVEGPDEHKSEKELLNASCSKSNSEK